MRILVGYNAPMRRRGSDSNGDAERPLKLQESQGLIQRLNDSKRTGCRSLVTRSAVILF